MTPKSISDRALEGFKNIADNGLPTKDGIEIYDSFADYLYNLEFSPDPKIPLTTSANMEVVLQMRTKPGYTEIMDTITKRFNLDFDLVTELERLLHSKRW